MQNFNTVGLVLDLNLLGGTKQLSIALPISINIFIVIIIIIIAIINNAYLIFSLTLAQNLQVLQGSEIIALAIFCQVLHYFLMVFNTEDFKIYLVCIALFAQ